MKRVLYLFLFILFPMLSFSKPITLDDCLNKAMKNNPDIMKTQKELDAISSKIYQAKTYFLPTLSLTGLYTHLSKEPPAFDFKSFFTPGATIPQIAGNPLLQYAHQNNYSGGLKLNQPLYLGGRNMAVLNSYKSEYKIKSAELEMSKTKLKVDVTKVFYSIVLSKEMEKLIQVTITTLQKHLDLVREFVKNGTATEYDSLKTESQLFSWQPRLIKTQREMKTATKQLAFLIGEEIEDSLVIEGELKYHNSESEISLKDATDKALENRSEIVIAQEMKKINNDIRNMKRASVLPQVAFQYNYNLMDKDADFTFNADNWENWWDIRILFNWEFFAFGRHRAEMKEYDFKKQESDINISSIEKRIKIELENAFDYKNENQITLSLWEKNIDVANRAYDIANDNYKNGTMTNMDVLDSHIALAEAKFQYLKALYDYKISCAELNRIIGY
ncbi:MAG: TolC family protein [bacterium]